MLPNNERGRGAGHVDDKSVVDRSAASPDKANTISKNSFTTQKPEVPSRSEIDISPEMKGTLQGDSRVTRKIDSFFSRRKVSQQADGKANARSTMAKNDKHEAGKDTSIEDSSKAAPTDNQTALGASRKRKLPSRNQTYRLQGNSDISDLLQEHK